MITWKTYDWLTQETWGNIHPEFPYKWYDPDCVIVDNESLKLLTKYKPKEFIINGRKIISNTAIGLISCQYPFHFGTYEIEAKIPEGADLWPAIWLWSLETWPPEIDIMEAYSNSRGSYFRWCWPIWSLQSNFHYRETGIIKSVGAKNMHCGLSNPASRFIKFGMEWTPEYIKITIDGKVRRTLKGDIMKHFQMPMRFVINNGVKDTHKVGSPASIFEIRNFNYKTL